MRFKNTSNDKSINKKDPHKRQCHLVKAHAKRAGYRKDNLLFFVNKREMRLDKQVEMCGEAP